MAPTSGFEALSLNCNHVVQASYDIRNASGLLAVNVGDQTGVTLAR